MADFNTTAIVLRRIPYGETDNILTLYSRERGMISAIAKGARKATSRLSGATEILTCSKLGLGGGKNLNIVRQAEVVESFGRLRTDLFRLANGLYMADLVATSVPDEDPHPEIYDLLLKALNHLSYLDLPEAATRWFELHLLDDLGYAPQLDSCIECGEILPGKFGADEIYGFAVARGGLVCPEHMPVSEDGNHPWLSRTSVQYLQALARRIDVDAVAARLAGLPPSTQDQARIALRSYISHCFDRKLKSLEFLESLRA